MLNRVIEVLVCENNIIENKLRKNLSIGDINYEVSNIMSSTSKHMHKPSYLTQNAKFPRYGMPSSTKNSSKPSTAASSLMKQNITYKPINLKVSWNYTLCVIA